MRALGVGEPQLASAQWFARYRDKAAALPGTVELVQRPGELVPLEELDWLRFEAIRKRGGWSLTAATVLDGPVE